MGVSAWAHAAAASRPHVLVAASPGATAVRLTLEVELRRRGWPVALSPAEADVLAVCGRAPAGAPALAGVWASIPAPRARVDLSCAAEVGVALDALPARLSDRAAQREEAARAVQEAMRARERQDRHGHGGDGGHGGHQADGGHGHEGRGGHGGHGGMVEGLPMAGRGEDRDGLKLDRLHLRLGPFLADWPAGLALAVTLQGDVIQEVEVLSSAGGGGSFWAAPWRRAALGEPVTAGEAARRGLAAHLDGLGRLLAVAGWPDAAVPARRLRDELLEGVPRDTVRPRLERLTRRVGRSRSLAWSTRGLGVPPGDVTARYRRRLAAIGDAAALLDEGSPLDPESFEPPHPPAAPLLAALPELLVGADLAGARLIVASLDPDGDELQLPGAPHGEGHGG